MPRDGDMCAFKNILFWYRASVGSMASIGVLVDVQALLHYRTYFPFHGNVLIFLLVYKLYYMILQFILIH